MPDPTGASPTPSTAYVAWLRQQNPQPDYLTQHVFLSGYAAAEAHYAPLVEAADLVLERAVWPASPPCPVEYLSAFRAFSDAVDALRAARQTAKGDM